MIQKYQNEIAPIFYYGFSTKAHEKDLKIPILQPPDWKHPYWMTLYKASILKLRYFLHSPLPSECLQQSVQLGTVQWCGPEASSLGPGQQPPLVRARVTQQLTLRPPAHTQCLSKEVKMDGLRNRFGFFKRRSNVDRSVVKGLVLI